MTEGDNLTRDLFHCCALLAYVEVAEETGQWPPDSELTRRRAYRLYEEELAAERAACPPAATTV